MAVVLWAMNGTILLANLVVLPMVRRPKVYISLLHPKRLPVIRRSLILVTLAITMPLQGPWSLPVVRFTGLLLLTHIARFPTQPVGPRTQPFLVSKH